MFMILLKKLLLKEAMDAPPATPPAIVRPAGSVSTPTSAVDSKKLQDMHILIATLLGEARGEGRVGMHAVMNVIMNRANGKFENAVKVVLKPKQFSFWNSIKDPQKYADNLYKKMESGKGGNMERLYEEAKEIVELAMNGQLKDVTAGAKFYFNPKLAKPSWASSLEKCATIKQHDFYRPKEKNAKAV